MSRPLRPEQPGATYHINANALDGCVLVRNDDDRRALVDAAAAATWRYGWECLAFCVMDTHYHMLVTTPDGNRSAGMQYLNGSYAGGFNRRHHRRGHLFRERFHDVEVVADGQLLVTFRYIALNPVAPGMVDDPAAYAWSSYAGVIGAAPCWSFIAKQRVLDLFGPPTSAAAICREFVEAPWPAQRAA